MLSKVGRTKDGKDVVAGVYKVFETHGLPLDILLGLLQEAGMVPCWMSFHREAVAAGMKHDRVLSRLEEAVSDAYGPRFRDRVVESLKTLYGKGLL